MDPRSTRIRAIGCDGSFVQLLERVDQVGLLDQAVLKGQDAEEEIPIRFHFGAHGWPLCGN